MAAAGRAARRRRRAVRGARRLRSSSRSARPQLSATAVDAKEALFEAIASFNAVRAQTGTVAVDFGVKGGELDEDTRAHCAPYTADDFDAIASTFASTRLRDAGFRVLNNAA